MLVLINDWSKFSQPSTVLYKCESTQAGRRTQSRMNNDTKLRGGGSKHIGLLFLLDISPRGFSQSPKCITVCLYLQRKVIFKLRDMENVLCILFFTIFQASVLLLCYFLAFYSCKTEKWPSQEKLKDIWFTTPPLPKDHRYTVLSSQLSLSENSGWTYHHHQNAR